MAWETWLLFVAISIAPVISPGPGILFAVANALTWGPRVTIAIGLVNAAGITALALAVGFGVGALMTASSTAYWLLKLVGGGYLIWLGWRIWRDRRAFAVEAEAGRGDAPMATLTAQAAAISLTNPKAVIALAALFPPFIDASAPVAPQVWAMAATYGGLCALNHVGIAYAGGWLRRFLRDPIRAAWLRRGVGATFMGFGGALVASGRP